MAKAAEILKYESHASVSKNIKALEQELGVTLFQPDARGVKPTEHAKKLYQSIKPLFSEINFIEKNVQNLTAQPVAKPSSHDQDIHLIATGGTIDGELCAKKQAIVCLKNSYIPEYLSEFTKTDTNLVTTQLMLKCSSELTQDDLSLLIQTIIKSTHDNILVSHGAYTIETTAKYLKPFVANTTKKVILVCSNYPIKSASISDAPFNLGFAMASFPHISPGTHTVIGGKLTSL